MVSIDKRLYIKYVQLFYFLKSPTALYTYTYTLGYIFHTL